MKKPVGLLIIASLFLVVALFGILNTLVSISKDSFSNVYLLSLAVSISGLIASIGLFLQKGWGRNFALFYNAYALLWGLINLYRSLSTFSIARKGSATIHGPLEIIVALLIFRYLFKREIKELFPKSPVSLIIIGFSIGAYGIIQKTGIALVDYFLLGVAIVGFSIIFKGARQLREK